MVVPRAIPTRPDELVATMTDDEAMPRLQCLAKILARFGTFGTMFSTILVNDAFVPKSD